jgi:MarR family transcriptional regulator, organic hydroperoxide resistance regulator
MSDRNAGALWSKLDQRGWKMTRKNNVIRLVRSRTAPRASRKGGARGTAADVVAKFRRVTNSTRRHFQWIEKETGISGALVSALWELHQAPGMRVSELAQALAVHQSTASNLVDKLQERGLIERDRSTDDQRVVRLHLTRQGENIIRRAPQPAGGLLREALHKLPASTLQNLDRLLAQLMEQLDGINARSAAGAVSGKVSG